MNGSTNDRVNVGLIHMIGTKNSNIEGFKQYKKLATLALYSLEN